MEVSSNNGYCLECRSEIRLPLFLICEGEDPKIERNMACWECREDFASIRECNSTRDRCITVKTCPKCRDVYAPCRGVLVWNDNFKKLRKDPDETEDTLIIVCAVCARHPGVTKDWWCKKDYIHDHGLARCVSCKKIDLTREKLWGRCPPCIPK